MINEFLSGEVTCLISGNNPRERIQSLVEGFYYKTNNNGENGLVLLLSVIIDFTDSQQRIYQNLIEVVSELRNHLESQSDSPPLFLWLENQSPNDLSVAREIMRAASPKQEIVEFKEEMNEILDSWALAHDWLEEHKEELIEYSLHHIYSTWKKRIIRKGLDFAISQALFSKSIFEHMDWVSACLDEARSDLPIEDYIHEFDLPQIIPESYRDTFRLLTNEIIRHKRVAEYPDSVDIIYGFFHALAEAYE